MTNSISSCTFNMQRMHPEAYEYVTTFSNSKNQKVSEFSTVFTGRAPAIEGRIIDVYSQNGCAFPNPLKILSDSGSSYLFGGKDVVHIGNAAETVAPLISENDRTVFVLDLKDSQRLYLDEPEITASEEVVCSFMGSSKRPEGLGKKARKIHDMVHQQDSSKKKLPVDYVLLEGRLKASLLKQGLTEEQASFFLNDKQAFCEYTELFMVALKQGHSWRTHDDPQSFMRPVSGVGSFQPRTVSSTMYPPLYAEMYSENARIPTELRKIFDVAYHPMTRLGITTMNLKDYGQPVKDPHSPSVGWSTPRSSCLTETPLSKGSGTGSSGSTSQQDPFYRLPEFMLPDDIVRRSLDFSVKEGE